MAELAKAMVLSAGLGRRMGDLSKTTPKPLTMVAGKSLLDRILAKLLDLDLAPIVVNVHHLADKIESHLSSYVMRGDVCISDERDKLLETGGGVKKANPLLDSEFFVVNSDILWEDLNPSLNSLKIMQGAWNPEKMDALLLLIPTGVAYGYEGVGDFFLDEQDAGVGPIRFREEAASSPFMYGGVLIVKSSLYDDMPNGSWSNREIFKKAQKVGRLYGIRHQGLWMHVGTEAAIFDAETRLAKMEIVP